MSLKAGVTSALIKADYLSLSLNRVEEDKDEIKKSSLKKKRPTRIMSHISELANAEKQDSDDFDTLRGTSKRTFDQVASSAIL